MCHKDNWSRIFHLQDADVKLVDQHVERLSWNRLLTPMSRSGDGKLVKAICWMDSCTNLYDQRVVDEASMRSLLTRKASQSRFPKQTDFVKINKGYLVLWYARGYTGMHRIIGK